jgi:ubiquinone/menaquinone biosynthesis C-methylase UbiE
MSVNATELRSYNIRNVSASVEVELNRLKAQVELFWDKEMKHYVEFGLKNRMSIVELGSGPGFLIEKLLGAFDQLLITGIEIDDFLVNYSINYLRGKHENRVNIIKGSIMDIMLSDESVDFAIIRLVLEHLPDPIGAVKEVYRILKPGGKAVLIDNDFEMHSNTFPYVQELRIFYDAYCNCRFDEGGNPKIGRYLPVILSESGFSDIDFEVICAHNRIAGDEVFFKSEGIGIPSKLVQDGYLESKILGAIAVKWRDMIKNNDHCVLRQLYMAVGRK